VLLGLAAAAIPRCPSPDVKVEDGPYGSHPIVKSKKQGDIKDFTDWILALWDRRNESR